MTIQSIKKKIKQARMSMMVIYLYGIGLIILFLMVISSWIANEIWRLNANIQILITFWNSYTTAAVIGAVGFISIFSVNKNKDGESDIAEKKALDGDTTINNASNAIKNVVNKIGR